MTEEQEKHQSEAAFELLAYVVLSQHTLLYQLGINMDEEAKHVRHSRGGR